MLLTAEYTIENTNVASEKYKAMKAVSKQTKQLAEMQAYDQAIAHVVNQKIEINALKVDLLARIQNVDKIGLSEEGGDYFR